MSDNPAKHEVLIKQYLRSIQDISGLVWGQSPLEILKLRSTETELC